MKTNILLLFVALASIASCNHVPRDSTPVNTPEVQGQNVLERTEQPDDYLSFRYATLNKDMVAFANNEYGRSKPNHSDPDNDVGTPPFEFVKRVDCDVIRVDEKTESLIKRSPATATFHTIVVLRDAHRDLYTFTLTSTAPDKNVVRLQNYGPLTDENPDAVKLPISQRRLKVFPIDFKTQKALTAKDGRCVYIPYPFPADQEYWLFGDDPHSAPLQGLYRNDRYKNVDEIINLIAQAVKQEEEAGRGLTGR